MTDSDGGPMCACLTVAYDPVTNDDGSMSERWRCASCGSVFRRGRSDDGARPVDPALRATVPPDQPDLIDLWAYQARVMRVLDGDTVDLEVDLGFHTRHRSTFRLIHCWCPELYSGAHRDAGNDAGLAVVRWLDVSDRAIWWQDLRPKPRKKGWHIIADQPQVIVRAHDGRRIGEGKYGRWLVDVLPDVNSDTALDSLNAHLVAKGLATRTRNEARPWER